MVSADFHEFSLLALSRFGTSTAFSQDLNGFATEM